MGFNERLMQANVIVDTLSNFIWEVPPLNECIRVVPFGYETRVSESIRQYMRFSRNATAKFIRFTPDFFVLNLNRENTHLLEYKVTQTPIYSESRIKMIEKESGMQGLRWQDIGQMEADAYDNYKSIHSIGVRVAILNYCAYNDRILLCDYIENIKVLHRDSVTTQTTRGSKTPFVNFYLPSMRSLDEFIKDEHQVDIDKDKYQEAINQLLSKLPVIHHENSPLNPRKPHR